VGPQNEGKETREREGRDLARFFPPARVGLLSLALELSKSHLNLREGGEKRRHGRYKIGPPTNRALSDGLYAYFPRYDGQGELEDRGAPRRQLLSHNKKTRNSATLSAQ